MKVPCEYCDQSGRVSKKEDEYTVCSEEINCPDCDGKGEIEIEVENEVRK
jgi:DnaJ-class molecular chaperone